MESENPNSPQQNPNVADPNSSQSSQPIPQVLQTGGIPPVQPPPAPHSYQITCQHEKDWRDKVKFWAELGGIILLLIYTCETHRTNNLTQCALKISKQQFAETQRSSAEQFRQNQRPWVALAEKNGITMETGGEASLQDSNRSGKVTLNYTLVNTGHLPAFIQIEGDFIEVTSPGQRDKFHRMTMAKTECGVAKQHFSMHPITVVPGTPSLHGIHYDSADTDTVAQHGQMFAINPSTVDPKYKNHQVAYVGCIAYQATTGDNTIHFTPFLAHVLIPTIKGRKPAVTGPWIIGAAD